jgi:hypothetical protein
MFSLVNFAIAIDSKLGIEDLTVYRSSSIYRTLNNGDSYNDFINPGDDIDIKFELENIYAKNIDILDIEIKVTIFNITKNNDIIEVADTFDLRFGKSKTKTINIDIPNDAIEIIKPVKIDIVGTDENGDKHEIHWIIYLNIEDEDHDVKIYTTQLSQVSAKCKDSVKLIVWLDNTGRYNEDKIVLEVENKELGIYEIFRNIYIKEDQKYTKVILFDIKDVKTSKNYPISIKTYYDDEHLDDEKVLDLFAYECTDSDLINNNLNNVEDDEENNQKEDDPNTNNQKEIINDNDNNVKAIESNYNTQISTEKQVPVFLIFMLVFLLALIIIIGVVLLRK